MERSVGVVIGRFQVDDLHAAHVELLRHVLGRHRDVLVLVGCPKAPASARNPLSYSLRVAMVRQRFPQVHTMPIHDRRDDSDWSQDVDEAIRRVFGDPEAVVYGGRDSCLRRYVGRHRTQEIQGDPTISATAVREQIAATYRHTPDFRAGVIHAYGTLQPRIYLCVDVAPWRPVLDSKQVALIRKADETQWRLPGGHVDVEDESLEAAAKRELREETGQVAEHGLELLGTHKVDDWRDRGVPGVARFTLLYAAHCMTGELRAGDDAAEACWFPTLALPPLVPEHQPLLDQFSRWLHD